MRKLWHEIWEEVEDGMVLHGCCMAGPRGDGFRRTLAHGARLLATFEASSHLEAMTYYNRYLGREEYTSDLEWDHQPYPEEWFMEQFAGQGPSVSEGAAVSQKFDS